MLWLVIGYLFLFIFRPYEYWPILGTFHVERIYMIVLLVSVLNSKNKHYVSHAINKSVLWFLLAIIAAALFAFDKSVAFESVQEYCKLLIFYFLIILTIRDEKDLKVFLFAYIVIMFLYVGKSAWEFFVNDNYWWRMGIKRMKGIDTSYGDPNSLAASIVYSLPFGWALFRLGLEQRWQRILLWGYGVLALVCIIYTGSRSGMVATILFLLLLLMFSSRKIIGILLIPLLLFGVWNTMPESYKIRFISTFAEAGADEAGQKGAYDSAHGRLAGLEQGYKTFLSHPVFGMGPGNFKYTWGGGTGEIIGMSAHNLYGQLLGELGGVGSVAFVALMWTIFMTHWRVRKVVIDQLIHCPESGESANAEKQALLMLVSSASLQTLALLLFNGNFGHNLFRYNYLWVGAIGVLCWQFSGQLQCGATRIKQHLGNHIS